MKIRNINGTSDNNCKCGSWLDHWKKYSGQGVPYYCPAADCNGNTSVGAHVQRDGATDRNWYIYPLCATCNAKYGQTLTVSDTWHLVSANVSETCGAPKTARG